MQLKMNLSFSIFLMLLLTHVALSVPVEKPDSEAQGGDVEKNIQKVKDLFKDLFEAGKKFDEEFKNLVKTQTAGLKDKFDELVNAINISENQKRVQDFFDELSKLSGEELFEKLQNVSKERLARIKARMQAVFDHIKSEEAKAKWQALLDEVSKQDEKLAEELKNFVEKDLVALKAKLDGIFKGMNLDDLEQKFKALLNEFPKLNPAEFYDKLVEILKKLNKEGSQALKGKSVTTTN